MEFSLAILLLITLLIIFMVNLVIYHYKRWDLYSAVNKIPGPRPVLPIIGNALFFVGNPDDVVEKFLGLIDYFKTSPVRVWLGHKLCLLISDPDQIKIILQSPKTLNKGTLYTFLEPWLETGLITAPANKWKIHRKLIVPTFHQKILESFIEAMKKQSEVLVKVMEPAIDGEEFDVFPYMMACTLDIICETALGTPMNVQTSKNRTCLESLDKLMHVAFERITKVWLHPDIIYNLTKLGKEQKKMVKYLNEYTDKIISQKRQQLTEKNKEDDILETTGPKRKIFLDLLMESSKEGTKFTDEEIREEVNTIMAAGSDTTAITSTFVILMLANFPEIQEKCYEEIFEIFGDKINEKKEIENEDLGRMEYLERVIKETLRLFPPGPFFAREASDDLDIGGGFTVPKSSIAILAPMKLHRSPDLWENPLRFDPDRFLPEQVAKQHPYAYIPFSAGPRNCIGSKYAMMSMKILLSTLLRNYELIKEKRVNIEDVEIKDQIIIRPAKPITVKIKRRQATEI